MSHFFDYYTASIPAKPQRVIDTLLANYDLCDLEPTAPHNGYERAHAITRGSHVLATIQYGGNTGLNVQAYASGSDSPEFANIIRDQFKDHGLVRADVAQDYNEPGAWESLSNLMLETADKYHLKVEHQGDFHREIHGRTLKIGSRSSVAYTRLYEKGKESKQFHLSDWVRCETEFKPQRVPARYAYAHATPREILEATKWTRYFDSILHAPTSTLRIAPAGSLRTPTDEERTITHLFKQYGPLFARKLEQFGGDYSALGLWIAQNLSIKSP